MTKVDYAELAAKLAPFLSGYLGPSTTIGSPYVPLPPAEFGIRLVRAGTGYIEWFPATGTGFVNACNASSNNDSVLVPAGTYVLTERLIIMSRELSIIGEDMDLCIIETNFTPRSYNLGFWYGGLIQGFTFNATWIGDSGGGTSSVLSLYGTDEETNKLINMPYIRDVTINMVIDSGATGINAFTYAIYHRWAQDSIFNDLDKTGPLTVMQNVYINITDYRAASYAMNGMAGVLKGRLLKLIVENVHVRIRNLRGHSVGIELEPSYEGTSFWEARNCSVDVEVATVSIGVMGWFIIDCNMYKCRTRVVGPTKTIGIEVNGGNPTIIKDCDVYASGNPSYGIFNEWSYSLEVINCSVVAV